MRTPHPPRVPVSSLQTRVLLRAGSLCLLSYQAPCARVLHARHAPSDEAPDPDQPLCLHIPMQCPHAPCTSTGLRCLRDASTCRRLHRFDWAIGRPSSIHSTAPLSFVELSTAGKQRSRHSVVHQPTCGKNSRGPNLFIMSREAYGYAGPVVQSIWSN